MPFGRSLLQKESLLRVSGEERSPEILILFHSSGSTSNHWRKLKNPWFPGRTPFRPSCCGTGKKKRFFAQLAHSAGPTCILYLAEEASDRLEFLPSWDSMDHEIGKPDTALCCCLLSASSLSSFLRLRYEDFLTAALFVD